MLLCLHSFLALSVLLNKYHSLGDKAKTLVSRNNANIRVSFILGAYTLTGGVGEYG